MTPADEAKSEAHSRRTFVTKAVTAAGIVWAAPVIATINQPAAAAHTLPILVSGTNFSLIAPPAAINTMQSDTEILGFAENCVVISGPVTVNRDGANGSFTGAAATTDVGGAGVEVCSYFIRSQRFTAGSVSATIQFTNATIIGFAFKNAQLSSTQGIFGVSGTSYAGDGQLENGDNGTLMTVASGDSTATFNLSTNGTGSDSVRILVVPS